MQLSHEEILQLPLFVRAEMALRKAFARVVAEHKQAGVPVILWKDGKVVHVPAEELAAEAAHPPGLVP